MHLQIARQLRDHLAKHPFGFPVSKGEQELEMLNLLFTESEAHLALHMNHKEETAVDIAKRLGKSLDETAGLLDSMARKGAIYKKDNHYSLVGYVPGMYEFQVEALDDNLAKLYDDLGAINAPSFFGAHTPPFRTIPVEKTLPMNIEIAPFERASDILKSASAIALTDCACRKKKGLLKKPCDKPQDDICIVLNGFADFYVENGIARKVNIDEAMKAITRAEDAGLVRQVTNVRDNPEYMCQCCRCCCGIMRAFSLLEYPTALVKSNYKPVFDLELCAECGECSKICPTGAIKMKNRRPVHNIDKCIGCGLCANECASGAIALQRKPSAEYVVPPMDVEELMTITAYETGRTSWYK